MMPSHIVYWLSGLIVGLSFGGWVEGWTFDVIPDTNVLFTKLPEMINARVEATSNIVESLNQGIYK